MMDRLKDRNADCQVADVAKRIYSHFESAGGKFLINRRGEACLRYRDILYKMGSKLFNALIFRKTRLSPSLPHCKALWEMLEYECLNHGQPMNEVLWSHKGKGDCLYVNLHDEARQIVKLLPGRVEVLPNTSNPDGISLAAAGKMKPIEFDPSVQPQEVAPLLQELVLDSLACRPENRLLLLSWLLSAFFLDYLEDKALFMLSGSTKAGKTTAVRILSRLLYGTVRMGQNTAAYFSEQLVLEQGDFDDAQAGHFPKRRQIGPKTVGYIESEVRDWILSRPASACTARTASTGTWD